jgi:hypothetical protein
MAAAKEKNESIDFKGVAAKWKKAKESVKDKYAQFAAEEKEEREKKRDLYEIAFGVKPRKPHGAYKFFLMDMAKQGKLGSQPLAEGIKLWKKVSDDDKEKYERLACRDKLAYLVKKMEYETSIKKTSVSKGMSPFNMFLSEMKGKFDTKDMGKGGFFDLAYKKWKKLDESTKKKYIKKSDEDKAEASKLQEESKARVHDYPKRPANTYNLYIRHNMADLKSKHPDLEQSEIFKLAGDQWNKMSEKNKEKYVKMFEKETQIYKQHIKDWKLNGYYTPEAKEKTLKGNNKRKSSQSRGNSASKSSKKAKKTKA